jgi:hypothetical protein
MSALDSVPPVDFRLVSIGNIVGEDAVREADELLSEVCNCDWALRVCSRPLSGDDSVTLIMPQDLKLDSVADDCSSRYSSTGVGILVSAADDDYASTAVAMATNGKALSVTYLQGTSTRNGFFGTLPPKSTPNPRSKKDVDRTVTLIENRAVCVSSKTGARVTVSTDSDKAFPPLTSCISFTTRELFDSEEYALVSLNPKLILDLHRAISDGNGSEVTFMFIHLKNRKPTWLFNSNGFGAVMPIAISSHKWDDAKRLAFDCVAHAIRTFGAALGIRAKEKKTGSKKGKVTK